jgi:hypothetical protein
VLYPDERIGGLWRRWSDGTYWRLAHRTIPVGYRFLVVSVDLASEPPGETIRNLRVRHLWEQYDFIPKEDEHEHPQDPPEGQRA